MSEEGRADRLAGAAENEAGGESRLARRAGRTYGVLFLAYAVFVTYGSIVPLDFRYVSPDDALRQVWADPAGQLRDTKSLDIQTHVFLYLPLTFLGMGFITKANAAGGQFWRASALLAFAVLLSMSVEVGQVYVVPRTACFGHWAYQCVGALAGVAAWALCGGAITRQVHAMWFDRQPRRQAVRVLVPYLVAIIAFSMLPLDVPASLTGLFDKLEHAAFHVVPFSDHPSFKHLASQVARMVPIGYLFFQLGRTGYTVSAVAVLGFLFAAAMSLVGVIFSTGGWSTSDVLLAAAGAAGGGWLADRFGPRATRSLANKPGWARCGRLLALAGVFGGVAAIAWFRWRPYNFTVPPEGLWACFLRQTHIPFYHQYWLENSFEAARNILTQFGVFMGLGLFVRAATEMFARGNRLLPSLLMVLLSAALEAGRLLIPDRIADVTTAAIGAAGGIAGVFAYTMILHVFVYGSVLNKSCDS